MLAPTPPLSPELDRLLDHGLILALQLRTPFSAAHSRDLQAGALLAHRSVMVFAAHSLLQEARRTGRGPGSALRLAWTLQDVTCPVVQA